MIIDCFAGPDAQEPISSLSLDGDAVWAASGIHAIKYLRGKPVCFSLPLTDSSCSTDVRLQLLQILWKPLYHLSQYLARLSLR